MSAEPVPMLVHELSLTPGCYTDPTGTAQMQELNAPLSLQYSMQYAGLYADIILSNPYEDIWFRAFDAADGLTREIAIEATGRSPVRSTFRVTTRSFGIPFNDSSRYIDTTAVAEGWSDAATTRLEYDDAYFAWSDHAVEGLMSFSVPRAQSDGTVRNVVEEYYWLRGCDPAADISFSQYDFHTPARCWRNSTGEDVACDGLNLWP